MKQTKFESFSDCTDDKLSLNWQRWANVRLAAKLTGRKVDVRSESQVEGSAGKVKEVEYELTDLTELEDEGKFEEIEDFSNFNDMRSNKI